jgi:sulfur-carrier protein adenylyltransferase/sulfurtransferase
VNNKALRYQRQMILPEVGIKGQEKLKNARVLVVGAGGLGCPVLSYLVSSGVGYIKVADNDLVEETNLHRQPLYADNCIGKSKVYEAARILNDINPNVSIVPLDLYVSAENICELVSDVQIIVDGSDNFATKYLLNDACVELGKTLVSGSIFCFEGQVSVFNAALNGSTRGPTYRCLFPEPPPAKLIPSCAEAGVLGVLPGVIGTLQATEVIKLIIGCGEVLTGRLLVFDALSMSFSEISFSRNEDIVAKTCIQDSGYYTSLLPCSLQNSDNINITPSLLRKKLRSGEDVLLIDVRQCFERDRYHIGGTHIPSNTLLANLDRVPRNKQVVFYCETGDRSYRAISMLRKDFGFTNLYNLEGGLLKIKPLVYKPGA